ncbi:MAG: type II toxin-antitoxin system RelE/ParE family toxin [Synergistaceae bacterium]|nr:type II toxin-antitoxin system RelE/ParE family toxin [Synergistaceae bacterium]
MWKIRFRKQPEKFLEKLNKLDKTRILTALSKLSETPYDRKDLDIKRLKGEKFKWRLRVGDWRIIYLLVEGFLIIEVIKIAPRGDVYKD